MRKINLVFMPAVLFFGLVGGAGAQDAAPEPSVPTAAEGEPLAVRFPSLPNPEVRAVNGTSVSHKSAPDKSPSVLRQDVKEQNQEHKAFEDFRRAELEELENDRKTLEAIQNALGALQLGDRLDFMLNKNGQLTASPETGQQKSEEKTKD